MTQSYGPAMWLKLGRGGDIPTEEFLLKALNFEQSLS
jgi:hypothetical protein